MRSYNPFTGETYREALHMSRIGREMICLMEGRHVHPSTIYPGGVGTVATPTLLTDYLSRLLRWLDFIKKAVAMNDDVFDFFYEALPGYEEVGRRRILLGCWGAFNNPDVVDYDVQEHGRLGQRDVRHPGRRRRRRAGDDQPGRHQPRHPHPARAARTTRTGPTRRPSSPKDPLGQPGRQAPPVEPDDDPQAAEARPRRRQLQLGDEPALVRQAHGRPPRARHRRRRAGAAVGDGAGQQGRHAVRARRRATACRSTCPKTPDTPETSLEWKIPQWSNAIERDRARIYFVAYAAGMACTSSSRRSTRCAPGARRSSRTSTSPTRRSAAASTRRCAACSRTTW